MALLLPFPASAHSADGMLSLGEQQVWEPCEREMNRPKNKIASSVEHVGIVQGSRLAQLVPVAAGCCAQQMDDANLPMKATLSRK